MQSEAPKPGSGCSAPGIVGQDVCPDVLEALIGDSVPDLLNLRCLSQIVYVPVRPGSRAQVSAQPRRQPPSPQRAAHIGVVAAAHGQHAEAADHDALRCAAAQDERVGAWFRGGYCG